MPFHTPQATRSQTRQPTSMRGGNTAPPLSYWAHVTRTPPGHCHLSLSGADVSIEAFGPQASQEQSSVVEAREKIPRVSRCIAESLLQAPATPDATSTCVSWSRPTSGTRPTDRPTVDGLVLQHRPWGGLLCLDQLGMNKEEETQFTLASGQ